MRPTAKAAIAKMSVPMVSTTRLSAESSSPAELHSQGPNDGPYGNQDQRDDRLIAAQWPESPEGHGDGCCYGQT